MTVKLLPLRKDANHKRIIGLIGEQTEEAIFPVGTPEENVLEALNVWVNNYTDSYYEVLN